MQTAEGDIAAAHVWRVSRYSAWVALAIAAGFYLFEFISRVEPSLATGRISAFYGLSPVGFGTLASVFFWVYAPMQIVVGLALDRYGARPLVIAGSLICTLGVFLFTATPIVALGVVGRLMTGFGASFAFVGALYLVNHWFAPRRFALLSGMVNAIGMLGTAIGGVALSAFVGDFGWRAVFFATGGVGLVVFVMAALFLHDAPGVQGTSKSSLIGHVRGKLVAVFSDRRTWLIAIVGMFYYVPISVYAVLWGNDALVAQNHLDRVQAELAVSMIFWGLAIGSIAFGAISDAFGHRKWLVVAGIAATAIAFSVAIYIPFRSLVLIGTVLFLVGFFGGAQMLTFAMAKEARSAADTGTIVAFVNMIGISGAMIFQPLTGYFLDLSQQNYSVALTLIPVLLVIAFGLALLIREERHPDHSLHLDARRKPG